MSAFFSPCDILLTQSTIKNEFRNGLSIEETACQLANKEMPKRAIQMIRVVEHEGKHYSLDNRRLAVFRLLQFVGKCPTIKVQMVPKDPAEWRRKFDAGSDHTKVMVRGRERYVIGRTKEQSTFPLQRIREAMRDTVTVLQERLQAIMDGMDSDDDESEERPAPGTLGSRPAGARQPLKCPPRRKNAADQRRGNKSGGQLTFPDGFEPFAAGKSRYAYRCRVMDGCVQGFSEGSYLVLKVFKPEYAKHKITQADADMQQEAARLADRFSDEAQPTQNGVPCKLHVRDAAVSTFAKDLRRRDGTAVLEQGTPFLLEREIFGEFRKFNSNNGWSSRTGGELPAAFSHWTWVKERKLVCDLQGYQGMPPGPKYLGAKYYYLFTDPAIMTEDGRFGITDLGVKGVQNWFASHECNGVCRALGIAGDRPQGVRSMPAESSSSYRETSNSYGPKTSGLKYAVAAPAVPFPFSFSLGALAEEDQESYDGSGSSYSLY